MAEAKGSQADSEFARELHRALLSAYDPAELIRSPLIDTFSLRRQMDAPAALRRIFQDAIAALKPDDATPPHADAWRTYHILQYRYIELIPQREIAKGMALSVRHFRRHEVTALQTLANYLWTHHGLQFRSTGAVPAQEEASTAGAHEDEMQWLRSSQGSEATDIGAVVRAALNTVQPLLAGTGVGVRADVPDSSPPLAVQTISLRQALVNILSAAAACVPGGHIEVAALAHASPVSIHIKPSSGPGAAAQIGCDGRESLEMARRLVALSGGTLELAPGDAPQVPFTATLYLPRVQEFGVLIIDDNADTQRLFRRYLEGTRYSCLGAADPHDALALAAELGPKIIILDVMLPGMDGWEVLGRLREHPATRMTPIIVCTILPQERLALTLGAAAFLRKPVSRADLLSTLHQLCDGGEKENIWSTKGAERRENREKEA